MSTPPPILPADADPVLGPMLDQFVTCVCAELQAANRPACACCLVWGNTNPPATFCDCDCNGGHGQAWVRVVRWDPSATVNQQTRRQCQAWRSRVWLEAGIYRCVAATSNPATGEPPTCEQRAADAWSLLTDARLLRQAAACCAAFKGRVMDFISEEPTQVSGACSGVIIQFTVDL